jgi:hypothetical protein
MAPPPATTRGAACPQASSGECEVAGSVQRRQNQRRASCFRNLCETTHRIQLINEFGTWQYIQQWGQLNVTQHLLVLTTLEQRVRRYQESQSNEELEDERLLDDAINETGTVAAPPVEDDGEQRRTAEQEVSKEIRRVLEYLLDVHGLPPVQKRDGVTRVMYENLNGLQSMLSKNEKLNKARQVINDLQADVVCYNEHPQNLKHKANRNGFCQMFNGGETELRAIAAHNVNEDAGKF